MHSPVGENDAYGCKDLLIEEAAGLRALPAFANALREYTAALARFRAAPRLLNKLIASETRFRLTGYLLYLDADSRTSMTSGGATYKRLYELCTNRREISPRVLKSTLAIMKLTGMITTRKSATDQRSKVYRPTARMLDFVNSWMPHAVNALDVLQPEVQRTQMWKNDPDFLRRFLVAGGHEHTTGKPLIDHMPHFNAFFGKREGAVALILVGMLAHIDGTQMTSRGDIARRFGLSKTQVSKLIAEGVRIGFFIVDDADVPSATPHLVDSYERWVSIELAFYARHMQPA